MTIFISLKVRILFEGKDIGASKLDGERMQAWRTDLDVQLIQTLSSPIQRAILEILLKTGRPLRPTEIQNLLPEALRPRSSTKLYYHLGRLQDAQLIFNDKISDKLSLYGITDKGRKLILQPASKEAQAAYIASLLAPVIVNKSEEEIRDAVLGWIK